MAVVLFGCGPATICCHWNFHSWHGICHKKKSVRRRMRRRTGDLEKIGVKAAVVREERRRRKKRRGRLMRKHEEERGRKRGEKRGSVERGVVVNTKRSRLDSLLAWPGSGSCQGGAES